MLNSTLRNWMGGFGQGARPAKRVVRDGRRWGNATELLEGRAMLSAVTASAPLAAEVASAKLSFEVPDVAGLWTVEITGVEASGTADVTQKGAKVTADISLPGFADFQVKSKFTKDSPDSITDKFKLKTPDGKVTVNVTIEFGDGGIPSSFTGSVTAGEIQASIVGTRVVTAPTVSSKSAKAATEYADVSGEWELTAVGSLGTATDTLNVVQSGPGGKKISGQFDGLGVSIAMKGKFDSETTAKGKATISLVSGGKLKTKFSIEFGDEYTTFSGTAVGKGAGEISLEGQRLIEA